MSKKYEREEVLTVTHRTLKREGLAKEDFRTYRLPELKELDLFLKGMANVSGEAINLAKVLGEHVADLQSRLAEAGMKIEDLDTLQSLNFDLSVVLLDYQALLSNLKPSRKQRRFLKHIGFKAGQAWFVSWIKSLTCHRTEQ